MSNLRAIVVASATLLAGTVASQAADLYGHHGARGSIKDDHSYMSAPRGGCPTWYARIDGGYSTYDRPGLNQVGIDEHVWARVKDGGNIGGGIGRYFNCNVRGDLTVDHRFKSDMQGFNPNPFATNYGLNKWGYESTALMANVYYDFNMGSRFTPYIGVGLGAVHNQFGRGKGVVGDGYLGNPADIGTPTTVASNSTWQAAGAFMTGFVFNVTDRMKLDTGYRFLYLGGGKTGQTANSFGGTGGPIHVENLHAHELRVGLRYDIR